MNAAIIKRPWFAVGVAVAICAVSLLLAACSKRTAPAELHVLRISQRNEPADLDPALAALPDEFFVIRALSEGLVIPAPTNSAGASRPPTPAVLPGIADHWELSDDEVVYTFHLRRNARWSNGDAVTANDFLESYRRALSPETAAPKASLFFLVKNAHAFASGELKEFTEVGFRAPDAATLVVTLERPAPQFLQYVASGPWIPVHLTTVKRHSRAWTRPENYVGNGPFTLVEWQPHQRIVVRKNPRFYAAAAIKLTEIQFIAFDNGDTEDRAYRAGQIDVTMAVAPTRLETYARERPAELHHIPLAETRYLSFNTRRPPLDDSRVRRALSLAIDRERIASGVLRGGHDAAASFLPPQLNPIHNAETIALNVNEARRLLADAGFPDGRGFPKLELSTWPATPVVEAVQAMWQKELGITVGLVTREAKVHIAALRDGQYDVGFMTAIPDVMDALSLLRELTSGAPGNYPHWSDDTYDELITVAAGSSSSEKRITALRAADTRLEQECPLAPLYYNARNWLMSPRVQGWQDDALWTRFYHNVDVIDP